MLPNLKVHFNNFSSRMIRNIKWVSFVSPDGHGKRKNEAAISGQPPGRGVLTGGIQPSQAKFVLLLLGRSFCSPSLLPRNYFRVLRFLSTALSPPPIGRLTIAMEFLFPIPSLLLHRPPSVQSSPSPSISNLRLQSLFRMPLTSETSQEAARGISQWIEWKQCDTCRT